MGVYPQKGKELHIAVVYDKKDKRLSFYEADKGKIGQEEDVELDFFC